MAAWRAAKLIRFPAMRKALVVLLAACAALSAQQERKLRAPDVRYEPSTPAIVAAMLELAEVKKGDVVYDLGCGDGRIVIEAARRYGARGVGIDIDPERISEARENARKAGVDGRVAFRNEDLFEAQIGEATVVTLYLWPWINLKLRPKLLAELKPGTRVVSNLHDMGDWAAEKKIEVDGHPIYLWRIPPRNQQQE
jgi:SAM-dependent methyltransferase